MAKRKRNKTASLSRFKTSKKNGVYEVKGRTHFDNLVSSFDGPVVEVHLSDINSREKWRRKSVIKPIAQKQISGQGWQGYIEAVDILISGLKENR